ncbi:MAG TPA: SRPBCC domain-containing protein [Chitinophagaceae bacterium]|nr:SRPBCC domain-containing protein [Chitinophagaceae bacterium]
MSNPLFVKNNITIQAPASRVWDALTNPLMTKKYMFGCETVSDWKPGSPLLWKLIHEGREMIAVKGKVVDIIPGKHLAYTTIDPNAAMEDIPENYLTVTYDLNAENGQTVFVVTQGDYAIVGNGEKRYLEAIASGGWASILMEIKKLVEAG